ncbi:MAG: polar amino acid transporter, inner rane subunit [Clostridiales bacterium]|nr:polar amino acid transporter, inner rane subunit [Clostridiales bacterium]
MNFFINLSKGTLVSIEIFFLTLLISLPLGMLVALGGMSRRKYIREPIRLYISIMRGTPLILQLVFVLYAPYYLLGINLDRFAAALIAFALNYAAYFSEIYRGGIESIPVGQYEAANVLGFTRAQVFFRIVLPQVIKRILPPISNEVITLVKDTALVQVVGISELFRVAQNETSRVFSTKPLFVAGVFYFVMNWAVAKVFQSLEKKLGYYR